MAPAGRRIKRESTLGYGGLITPDESMHSAGTVTPKREIDLSSVSDFLEDPLQGTNSSLPQQHGLPSVSVEPYPSEQERRSESRKSLPY